MPQLATLICILFIVYLFWMDLKKDDDSSKALWIPLIWMFFAGSRYLSQWLDIGTPIDPFDAYVEGNPVNSPVFIVLIVAGIIVLFQRRLEWGRLLIENKWITLFFLYCTISILWSDYPFVSFKRLIKSFGNVIMALLILTEKRPYVALGVVLRRLAFLLLPLSVLFIKYYPNLGRAYTSHTGLPMYIGVTTQKNLLGQICMLFAIYFSWNLILNPGDWLKIKNHMRIVLVFIIMAMITWLMYMANSATSLACLVIAIGVLLIGRMPSIIRAPNRLIVLGVLVVSVIVVLVMTMDLDTYVIGMLGRDATLTTRVPIWHGLLDMVENPVLGAGVDSFWLGERLEKVWATYGQIHQAHNGYLEIYLNLGWIGLVLLSAMILVGLNKSRKYLNVNYTVGILRLCYIAIIALYNWTEASFVGGPNIMWILFLLGCIDAPKLHDKTRTI